MLDLNQVIYDWALNVQSRIFSPLPHCLATPEGFSHDIKGIRESTTLVETNILDGDIKNAGRHLLSLSINALSLYYKLIWSRDNDDHQCTYEDGWNYCPKCGNSKGEVAQ